MTETPQWRTRLPVPDFKTLYPWDERGARDNFYDIIEGTGWHTVVGGRQGLAGTVPRPSHGSVWVWLEAEDLYDLAMKTRDLEDELNSSFGTEVITLNRPRRVERKDRL